MFWHLRMILTYKKTLGKFTKVLGFEKTPPPLGKNSQKIPFFWGGSVPYQHHHIGHHVIITVTWSGRCHIAAGKARSQRWQSRNLWKTAFLAGWCKPCLYLILRSKRAPCRPHPNHSRLFSSPLPSSSLQCIFILMIILIIEFDKHTCCSIEGQI